MPQIDTIIFDLGGVLIDWNPRYLYRKIFKTEEEVTWFLDNICTSAWNVEQDGGRSFAEATELLVAKHPEWEEPIRAYYGRFTESFNGAIQETVEILDHLKNKTDHRLYALTNWSAESWPYALDTFPFLHWFEGVVVSGVEKTRKPYHDIYQIVFDRYKVDPKKAIFIDDNHDNVMASKELGVTGIHFKSSPQLREDLQKLGVLS
jgi:2-haloacid dehalogenase